MTNAMTKKDLIKKLATKKDISLVAAGKLWDEISEFIYSELVAGNGVKIKGVGTLRRVDRVAYEARVPNSSATTQVPDRYGFKLKSKRYNVIKA